MTSPDEKYNQEWNPETDGCPVCNGNDIDVVDAEQVEGCWTCEDSFQALFVDWECRNCKANWRERALYKRIDGEIADIENEAD